jgi:hypothetical protein
MNRCGNRRHKSRISRSAKPWCLSNTRAINSPSLAVRSCCNRSARFAIAATLPAVRRDSVERPAQRTMEIARSLRQLEQAAPGGLDFTDFGEL